MTAFRPEGWPTVVPRIFVDDPAGLVEFMREVFGAAGTLEPGRPAEMKLGDSIVMVSGDREREPMAACLYVYVPDADAACQRALEAGAEVMEPPLDTPYGDRRATVRDRWGNVWQIATRRHG